MIEKPLYAQAMDGIVSALKEVASEHASQSPSFDFKVYKNKSQPSIEDLKKQALVNVRIFRIDSEKVSIHSKEHKATYHLDMYVKGMNSELTPPDESASERLDLLVAQVEYAISRQKNVRFGLPVGKIARDLKTPLQFYDHEHEDSVGVYAPARFELVCRFPYTVPDDTSTVNLVSINVKLLEDWEVRFSYSSG